MMAESTLVRLQAASGLVLAGFLSVHLASHLTVNLGWDVAQQTLQVARLVYRAPLAELVIFPAALAIHLAVGAVRATRRWAAADKTAAAVAKAKKDDGDGNGNRNSEKVATKSALARWNPWAAAGGVGAWQRLTGLTLTVLLVGHVYATRISPVLFLPNPDATTDYAVVTASLRLYGPPFYVYYMVLGGAGAYHLIHGVGMALATLRPGTTATARASGGRSVAWRAASAALALGLASAVLAFGGVYYPIVVVHAKELLELHHLATFRLADLRGLADVVAGP